VHVKFQLFTVLRMPIVAGIFYCIDHSPHTFNLLLTSDMSDNELWHLLSTYLDTTLE